MFLRGQLIVLFINNVLSFYEIAKKLNLAQKKFLEIYLFDFNEFFFGPGLFKVFWPTVIQLSGILRHQFCHNLKMGIQNTNIKVCFDVFLTLWPAVESGAHL